MIPGPCLEPPIRLERTTCGLRNRVEVVVESSGCGVFGLNQASIQLLRLAARGDAGAREAALVLAEMVLLGGAGEGGAGGCGARGRELAVRVLGMAARGDERAVVVALDLADVVMATSEAEANIGDLA